MNTDKLRNLLGELRSGDLEEGMAKYSAYWVKQLPTDLMTQTMRTITELGGETDRFGVTMRDDAPMTTGKIHIHEASLAYQVQKNPNAKLLKAFMPELRKWGLKKTESKARGKRREVRFEGANKERVKITFEYEPKREWGWVNVQSYDARSRLTEDTLEERAPLPRPGDPFEADGQTFKIVRVYPTRDWAQGPISVRLWRLLSRNGAAAIGKQIKGTQDKGHYLILFNKHGDLEGHPVWMKPAQVKRAMRYESVELDSELLDEAKYPTTAAGDLLEKMANRVIPMVARSVGAVDDVLPYLSGQKSKEMVAKARQAATLITQANTKLYEAHGLLNEIKRAGK